MPPVSRATARARRDDAGNSGREERRQIRRELGARQSGAISRRRGAELMTGEDPAEDDVRAFGAEIARRKLHRRGTVAIQSRP